MNPPGQQNPGDQPAEVNQHEAGHQPAEDDQPAGDDQPAEDNQQPAEDNQQQAAENQQEQDNNRRNRRRFPRAPENPNRIKYRLGGRKRKIRDGGTLYNPTQEALLSGAGVDTGGDQLTYEINKRYAPLQTVLPL